MMRFVLAAALALLVAGTAPALSAKTASSTPAARASAFPTSLDAFQISGPDIARLLRAVDAVDKSPAIVLQIDAKTAADMPAYDPAIHYAGLAHVKGKKTGLIWMDPSAFAPPMNDAKVRLYRGAMMLAVMDYGFAGAKWKAIYDVAARADAALGDDASDRYRSRHAIVRTIYRTVDDIRTPKASPPP
ncbi:MAG: hypothetical protein GIW95_05165 [Candidatus Eremiobacteraeota bacterium]|nr:hypothetical protein [Candidatus Eremiobacteraeota bacterium]